MPIDVAAAPRAVGLHAPVAASVGVAGEAVDVGILSAVATGNPELRDFPAAS